MTEPTSHVDTFIRDNMPGPELWPEMDYSVLPELAAYPARFNVAVELIDKQVAAGYADKPALMFGEQTWTYRDLMIRTNRIANVLVEDYGFVPGERVLIRSGNHPMLIACWLAVLKAGGVAITTMPVLRERELVYMIGKAKVRFAISHDNLAEDIDKAKASAEDLEHILYFGADRADGIEGAMAE